MSVFNSVFSKQTRTHARTRFFFFFAETCKLWFTDKDYLAKSAGYDPSRSWDKEEALFEEAKADVERLRKLDSEQPLGKDAEDLDEPSGGMMEADDDDDDDVLKRIEETDVEEGEDDGKSEDENDE